MIIISLGVNELPKHPGYKKPENKKNIRALNKVKIYKKKAWHFSNML